jgi:hypothetical protein
MPSEKTRVYLDELDDRFENRARKYHEIKIDELVKRIIDAEGLITTVVDDKGCHVHYKNVIAIREQVGYRTYFFGKEKIIDNGKLTEKNKYTSEDEIRKIINSYLAIGTIKIEELNGDAHNLKKIYINQITKNRLIK